MSFIFAVYANNYYKEIHLPVVNDTDYELFLWEDEFALSGGDLPLYLEAVEGVWSFKSSDQYRVLRNGKSFEGLPLEHGAHIVVQRGIRDQIALLVWKSPENLTAFRKFWVLDSRVTIGKGEENDICDTEQKVLSGRHAEIVYSGGQAVLHDSSTNGTYLGNRRVYGETALHFGDLINLYGLTVLYLGDVLAINCLDAGIKINSEKLREIEPDAFQREGIIDGAAEKSSVIVHISPRNLPRLYKEPETIDSVPSKREDNSRPAWMSILPPLTMVLPMLVGFFLMNSGAMGFGIVISAGSAIVGVAWAIVNYRYALKERLEGEKRRQEKYEAYLVQCTDRIREKFESNRASLLSMYPDAAICSAYTAGSAEIWARRPRNFDFLFLRLGLGGIPFPVEINVPKHTFSLVDDELAERPEKIAQSYKLMRNVPVGVKLDEYNVIGLLSGSNSRRGIEMVRVIAAQLAANHCYTDVKLAAVYHGERDTASMWDFVRWLPHVWNEDRSMRYVADDPTGMNEVFYSLAQIFRSRQEQNEKTYSSEQNRRYLPHYVLLVEDTAMLESQAISKYLYEDGKRLGVTTIILGDSYENLPSTCDFVIEVSAEFNGIYGTQVENGERTAVQFDALSGDRCEEMARRMSSMQVNQTESGSDIPNSVNFFEMMGVSRLEELNVLEHWRKNRTYETMRAVIGKKMGGQDCYLDINEKYHGPHGLIAGTTGSGKSETLQTYILSLAINYSPLDVGFFIIDFKGGGMANLFSNLPHMMGRISNLSGNQVRRAMVSIKSENKRRERIFGEYGVKNIDEYTRLVKNREAPVPIPHMLIIIDEFAELKREEPEFMNELISVSQIGRSLGVHLILATQKPAGTVDEKIRSNTRFKLCLRVADKQDSTDMLHKPDAAYLTRAGRCYIQVGNDEIYELFQSGWSGAVYDETEESTQSGVALIDLQGREPASGGKDRNKHRKRQQRRWMELVISSILSAAQERGVAGQLGEMPQRECEAISKLAVKKINLHKELYAENNSNLQRLERVIGAWPREAGSTEDIAEKVIERLTAAGEKLPEPLEKTQLDAVVEYLAELAEKNGFQNDQKLWMPLLPNELYLNELPGFQEAAFRKGKWPEHKGGFHLSGIIGKVDDPENQVQYPLSIDLAEKGHLIVAGGVTSGKSTFLQSYLYSLICGYSPAELNIYAVDFSSQMLSAFANDAHVGGVVIEGEDDRLDKLFGMISDMLDQRKKQIRGGSFAQYVQAYGNVVPAVILAIDGYGNFNEKTEGRFENILLELSRSAEGYGIYLVISCGGFGSGELQAKIANNMRQSITLELGDKYRYAEILRMMHFDVLPEANIKGRGLVALEGEVLEYQTALACPAENDYMRAEELSRRCQEMTEAWTGKRAEPIPSIPEKPIWTEFCKLNQYQELLKAGLLPAGYYRQTAALYGVDLRQTYCYLVLGTERSGKSVFLRNLMCAAKDTGGKLCLIDSAGADKRSANLTGAEYVVEPESLSEAVRELILLTNERGTVRKEMRQKGLDDEEVMEHIAAQYPPVYYFIANLKDFLDMIYTNINGIGKLNSWIENIFEKGQFLNVHFFAAANLAQVNGMMDKLAYRAFVREKNGVLIGGELNKQSVFSYQDIPYSEQEKRIKTGSGYAAGKDDETPMRPIVIPNNRGVVDAL